MRVKILIPILLLALVIFILVHNKHEVLKTTTVTETAQATNQSLPSKTNVVPQNNAHNSATAPVSAQKLLGKPDRTPEGFQKYIDSKNSPIEFYGKVIDQDSNAISGAKIKIGIRQWYVPIPGVLNEEGRFIDLEQISDVNGRFEFHGATGDDFGVIITKEGYELEQNKYGSGPKAGTYDNPVIFKMWSANIHEQLIIGKKAFQIVPDGRAYFIELTAGTISESGTGDLKIWVNRPAQITYGQRYDWSCEIDAINGGLLQENDHNSSMYSAPLDGYVPSFQFEQKIGSGWGDTTGPQRFYITLNNGQKYGRIVIELYARYSDQIPGLIRLSYAINPSGSRILR
jgi:hypothetical protein